MSAVTAPDPTREPGRWDGLHRLLAHVESEIEQVYADHRIAGVRPRFAYPMIRLAHTGPLTIKELAASLERTHSAMSQTVAAMRRQGLVDTEPGDDARTRTVVLTAHGRALVPFLEAEWRATEAAIAELDDQLPHALSVAVAELEEALAARPMRDRILEHLDVPDGPADEDPS